MTSASANADDALKRTAHCHCGSLHIICMGDPRKISMCHCDDCQRRTGSLFSIAVFYNADQITIRGRSSLYERASASGFPVAFHFCPDCGSNMWWKPARMPDLIGVAAGCFADPALPAPEQAVWLRDKHHWIDLPPGMQTFDQKSGAKALIARHPC
jgi:hypothetical protein